MVDRPLARRFRNRLLVALAATTALAGPALADDKPRSKSRTSPPSSASAEAESRTTGARLPYIDEMIKEAWASASIKPSPLARDEEFMRRAYLDLLGRIPNLTEAKAYLGSRESGKRAKLVEYLLNHPDYAKNMATVWKVILVGRQRQEREVNNEALTTWLRRQFGDNRPWNEVTREIITASGSNKENGAVNFTLAHMEAEAVPLTSITARVFLGQQIQCTQCHDHPSNDWKQADFWGINAFYKGLRKQDVQVADATGVERYDHTILSQERTDAYSKYERRDARLGIAFPTFLDGRKVSQNKDIDRRVELAKFVTEPKNAQLARAFVNRIWGQFMGRGFVSPVDDFGAHNPPSHPELLDRLAASFQESGYDVKQLIRWIMNSEAYQLTSVATKSNEKDETLFSHMTLKPMTPEQLFDSLITATSAHKTGGGGENTGRRDAWLRQFLFTFGNDEGEENSSFTGTIPQALMMMNGDLMEQAVGGRPGSFLAEVFEQARLQGRAPELYAVNQIYLAALGRVPTNREIGEAQRFLASSPDTPQVLEDLFWALLNSNEFILNR